MLDLERGSARVHPAQSKRAISLAGNRPFCPIFVKLWFGFQITTQLSRSYQLPANRSPRSTDSFRDPTRRKSFLLAIYKTLGFPWVSRVSFPILPTARYPLSPSGRSLFR
jgi:hypothetical protein